MAPVSLRTSNVFVHIRSVDIVGGHFLSDSEMNKN